MIEYRLQFFAKEGPGGEKTEKPTAKKLEDARKEGQVVKSREVSNAFTMIALFVWGISFWAALKMLISIFRKWSD